MSKSNKKKFFFAVSMLFYGIVMTGILATIKDYLSAKYIFIFSCGLLYTFGASIYVFFNELDISSFLSKWERKKIRQKMRRETYNPEDDNENYVDAEQLFKEEEEIGIMRIATPIGKLKSDLKEEPGAKASDTANLPKRRRYVRHISSENVAISANCKELDSNENVEHGQTVTNESCNEACNEACEKNENMQTVNDISCEKVRENTKNANQTTYRCHRRPHKNEIADSIPISMACENIPGKVEMKQLGITVHCDNSFEKGEKASSKNNDGRIKKSSNTVFNESREMDKCSTIEHDGVSPIPIKLVVPSNFLDGIKFTICFNAA